ncbi:MarR family winged helix-turn-helix transcriptional regulator [Asticcacaulis solisilvae]|uniref:MarR family winged helix-turn-helix transcriptional regulator n=1 Tax=Asticcacaulis solisilvae TaxID=1217274 RepID=UPI003FD72B32
MDAVASRPQRVLDNLRRVVQAVRQSSAQIGGPDGVTSAQLLILKLIDAHAGISVGDLAARTLTHQSSVSEVVGRLETRGLIVRVRAADDGRRREIQLTGAGRQALSQPVETIQETLIKAMAALPPETLAALDTGLAALIAEAGIAIDPVPMFLEDGLNP